MMLQADSGTQVVHDTLATLSGNVVADYAAAWFMLIIVVLGLGFTLLRPKGSDPTPLSQILQRATQDGVPSLLAIALTATVIALAVTRVPINPFLSQAYLVVIGYYFGQRAGASTKPGSGPAEPSP
jgi:hypothetical protein